MISRLVIICAMVACALPAAASDRTTIDALVAHHARVHGIPETLIHRIIKRESGYNPRALSRGNFGLMQIRYATAQGMGYRGTASGLLDANTNLTFAVPYLANAYKVAGGNPDRAVALYAGGYYYVAKRKGILNALRTASSDPLSTGSLPAPASAQRPAAFSSASTTRDIHSTADETIQIDFSHAALDRTSVRALVYDVHAGSSWLHAYSPLLPDPCCRLY